MSPNELCFVSECWANFKMSQLGPYNFYLSELGIQLKLSKSSFKPNKNQLKTSSDDKVMA